MLTLSEGRWRKTLRALCRWVRAIWYKWIVASCSGVEWWNCVRSEMIDFLIHSSLTDIGLAMVLTLSECRQSCGAESRWIRSIWDEWHIAAHSGVEWRGILINEVVNFFVHSSFSGIFIFMMMLLLRESRWRKTLRAVCGCG
jgi:hypothetical protein